ncbi:PREDICTED: V-type proton ATPase 116 kDa subunit a isoform 1-like [Priapulus caudatus]|uniref:V-type proton ATPase subunit a n=1 Tax=Priapulus caudatus TaxID=37621 RepID=A0ABM1EA07_PRICU|nr:PREDICTED: V-type proton ATPase 116 kDa subunit a isoform 1-like [Priapulus caudatus]
MVQIGVPQLEDYELNREPSANSEMQLVSSSLDASGPTRAVEGHFGFVSGVILRERLSSFERVLWRACRGNIYLKFADIDTPLEDPVTGDQVNKCVFIILFQGEQLKSRVKKICEGFRATLYPCPDSPAERREMAIGVMTRIEDLNIVLSQTQDHRHRVLVAAAKNINVWFVKVQKIKAIYHALNLFNLDVTRKCLIAECWFPADEVERVNGALRRGTEKSGIDAPSILSQTVTMANPPTYNRTNKFTSAFQSLVDAYGVASYREVNPAPFTIISFPFLFAVMFGDTGHAMLMLVFAAWMVIKEKSLLAQKSTNEIWNTFFGGRYIILLMALFSIYTGLIYNDFYSKSVNLFGTAWHSNYTKDVLVANKQLQMCPNKNNCVGPNNKVIPTNYRGYPYPLGMDPIWMISVNMITYSNSFKMKMSVIIGVCQMLFGVILSIFNHRYFKQPLNVFAEFIPQLIFLNGIFGYLCVLIIAKWISWAGDDAACAPSLLLGLINMFLFKYVDEKDSSISCSQKLMFPAQKSLQTALVFLAVISALVLLLLKPLVLNYQHKKKLRQAATASQQPGPCIESSAEDHLTPSGGGHGEKGDEDEFDFGEMFVHQCIHTIEFCLGCVSHTASYLRLWALSLAHGQLSEVLWTMILRMGFSVNGLFGSVMIFAVFAPWLMLTIGILLVMEGLSAFLHTLRLHWVEFQSKFYIGDGEAFIPFSFDDILDQAEASNHEVR